MSNKNRTKFSKLKYNSNLKKTYYSNLKYPEVPIRGDDTYVLTLEGDRLDLMANQFYGDIRLWWIIAQANPDKVRRDSYSVKGGIELRIPRRINAILRIFESINK